MDEPVLGATEDASAPPIATMEEGLKEASDFFEMKDPLQDFEGGAGTGEDLADGEGKDELGLGSDAGEEGVEKLVPQVIDRPLIPKERISSPEVEREVESMHVRAGRALLAFSVSQPRFRFGSKYEFNDRDPRDKGAEFRHARVQHYKENLERSVLSMGFQVAAPLEDSATQTEWRKSVNKILQYEPQHMTPEEQKAAIESPEMLAFLEKSELRCQVALQGNCLLDLFYDELGYDADDEEPIVANRAENNLKEVHSFTHATYSKNHKISSISWHPTRHGLVSFGCTHAASFDSWVDVSGRVISTAILVWNFSDLLHPEMVLEVPGNLMMFVPNPANQNYIIAGLYSGQVVMYDLSEARSKLSNPGARAAARQRMTDMKGDDGQASSAAVPVVKPTMMSQIGLSHARPVTDLIWLNANQEVTKKGELQTDPDSKVPSQFLSLSGDGHLLVWDIRVRHDPKFAPPPASSKDEDVVRELKWMPVTSIPLTKPDLSGLAPVVKACLHENTTLVATTEDGELALIDFIAKSTDEKSRGSNITKLMPGHTQACFCVERCPHFNDVYMTVADWTFKVWRTDMEVPILVSACAADYYTCGRWSPTRAGVLALGRADGAIEMWDLLDQCHKPSLVYQLGNDAVTSLEFWSAKNAASSTPQYLGAGDTTGKMHVVLVPRNLAAKANRELMAQLLDRESKRVRYTQRRTQARAQERKAWEDRQGVGKTGGAGPTAAAAAAAGPGAAAGAAGGSGAGGAGGPDDGKDKCPADVAEANYQRMLKDFKAQLEKKPDA